MERSPIALFALVITESPAGNSLPSWRLPLSWNRAGATRSRMAGVSPTAG